MVFGNVLWGKREHIPVLQVSKSLTQAVCLLTVCFTSTWLGFHIPSMVRQVWLEGKSWNCFPLSTLIEVQLIASPKNRH